MTTQFKWKRFWHPSDDEPSLSEDGFLQDRASAVALMFGTTLFTLQELADEPCLVLLGEPGMGKSTEIAIAFEEARETIRPPNVAMLVQLRDVDSRGAFREKVELTQTFQAWLKGEHVLTLFLDSLDEGLLGFSALSTTIAEFLQHLPYDRLRLRLVSRTADWPAELANAIASKWKAGARSLTLAPLREEDVGIAATEAGQDATAFLADVSRRAVGALAARPVTLRLLLKIYEQDRALPRSRTAIYDRGCRLLAVEESISRKSARRVGTLDGQQRMAIAGRIAFVLIFSNKSAVWNDSDSGAVPSSDVIVDDLLTPRRETALSINLTLARPHLEEVLRSALFTLRGPSRFAFAHQTFAEHLAAWYVAHHRPPWAQLRSFLFARQGAVERVVPQLRETAARLAEQSAGVLRRIAKRDPEVLLRSLDAGSTSRRAVLMDALVNETRRQRLPISDDYTRDTLSRLSHARLTAQVAPLLAGKSEPQEVRRFAADVAAACKLTALADSLARIAVDDSEAFLVRYDALAALVVLNVPTTDARLATLALHRVEDDDFDQLKGMALSLVWPSAISREQLFGALTWPRRSSMYGPYQQFLDNLGQYLGTHDLPIALDWAALHATDQSHIGKCVSSILLRAWGDLDDAEILKRFALVAYARLRDHRPVIEERADFSYRRRSDASEFAELLASHPHRRRLIAAALLERVTDSRDVFTLMHSEPAILLPEDAAWLLSCFATEKRADRRAVWLEAVVRLFYHSGDPHTVYEHLYPAALEHEDLHRELADFIDGVELSSERAGQLRESEVNARRWRSLREERNAYPPTVRQIVKYLESFESGNLDAWWHLCVYLARNDAGTEQDLHYISIVRQAGWALLDHPTQERVARAALAYLNTREPALDEWQGKNVLYHPDVSGIRALHLMFALGPDRLPPDQASVWGRWGSALIAVTIYDNRDHEADIALIGRAFMAAPDMLLPSLERLVKEEDASGHGIFVLARLDNAWEQVSPLFLQMLSDHALTPRSSEQVLLELLKRQLPQSGVVASNMAVFPLPSDDLERQYAIAAMQAIMKSGSPLSYSLVWPRIIEDPAFGQELLLSVATNRDWLVPDISKTWGEVRVAELYLWLATHFPPSEDPQPEGVFTPSPRFNIGRWRQQLLSALSTAGTWEAVGALLRIDQHSPGLGHAHALRAAREAAWRATWNPPTPFDALKAITNGDMRLVRNGDDLLHLVNESLYRFQGELVGTTPLVRSLWHRLPNGRWRPDDEGALADAIERHFTSDLRTRGIVAGREVVIRRGAGSRVPGSRTDITVSAITPGQNEHSFDTATVIVEVKCSWNPDVLTALDTQLVGDYLVNNQRASHGVYVVGWYASPAWDRTDRRRGRSARRSMSELLEAVSIQARRASERGHRVLAGVLDVSLQQNLKRPKANRRSRRASDLETKR